ncbi:MAG: ATP-binding cassette domain-containing protein [Idiomarina sp.]|nr:ATP-binding cassette domain-containing protein [Idiomarina sp.]
MATIKKQGSFAAEKHYLTSLRAATGRSLLWAKVFGSVHAIALVAQMGIFAWLVHSVLAGARIDVLWPFIGLAVFAIGTRVATNALQHYFSHNTAEQAQNAARNGLLRFWQQQMGSGNWQHLRDASAANDIVEPVANLAGYYGRYLPQIWLAAWQPLVILIVVFYLNWLAGLFLLISAPLIPIFMALVGMGAERIHQQHAISVQRLASLFIDRVRNLTLLFLLRKIPSAQQQVASASDEYRQLNMKTLKVAFLSSAVLEFFAAIAIAAIAIYIGFSLLGYYEVGPGSQLTLFSGLFILLLAPEFFQPLRTLSQFYHDRAAALGAASILCRQYEPAANASAASVKAAAKAVAVDTNKLDAIKVEQPLLATSAFTFNYAQRQQHLQIPALQLHAGETLLLKGPSGAGKSTVLQLIAGLLPGMQGNLNQSPLAYVPQSAWLIHGSIRENLQLFAIADEALLMQILEQMGLIPLIERLPQGIDTVIGENGAGVSGGEAKRLTLARWLFALRSGLQPRLILLDEPSAALDDESALYIVRTVQYLQEQGMSMVIATHSDHFDSVAQRTVHMLASAEHNAAAKEQPYVS